MQRTYFCAAGTVLDVVVLVLRLGHVKSGKGLTDNTLYPGSDELDKLGIRGVLRLDEDGA